MDNLHTFSMVAVIALVTAALRFLPFVLFNGNRTMPKAIEKLGSTLPYAIMGMLVVYCLKGVNFSGISHWLPELIACTVVGLLYIWKRNTLISILCGTLCYMLLVQLVF